jgi:hypothetical protein
MSRTIRILVAVFVVSLALAASACANATGPQQLCDYTSGNVCH